MPNHLSKAASSALDLPTEEWLRYLLKDKWFGYQRANSILNQLDTLFIYPEKNRMPNLLIFGETNNGKTTIAREFCSKHPARNSPREENAFIPVVYIQAPQGPDESLFFSFLLDKLNAPYNPSDRLDKKQLQSIKILKAVKTRIFIIDEIHNIISGSLNRQRRFLNTLRFLGNELKIPLVAVGTLEASRAIQSDPQLANRFEQAPLPQWEFDEEYLQLLDSFEYTLPLKKPSNLSEDELARHILDLSEGAIGEISNLLTKCATLAIKTGEEHISQHLLEQLEWARPSERAGMM